jgi:hypothetical protein
MGIKRIAPFAVETESLPAELPLFLSLIDDLGNTLETAEKEWYLAGEIDQYIIVSMGFLTMAQMDWRGFIGRFLPAYTLVGKKTACPECPEQLIHHSGLGTIFRVNIDTTSLGKGLFGKAAGKTLSATGGVVIQNVEVYTGHPTATRSRTSRPVYQVLG